MTVTPKSMWPRLVILSISIGITFTSQCEVAFAQDSEAIDFARDVLPILSDRCFQCHGPDPEAGREANLRLDDRDDLFRTRGDYHIVVPGDPEGSELFQRISTEDDSALMPPPELDRALSPEQVDILRRWIQGGAKWGKHWAFEKPVRADIPAFSSHPIDALIAKVHKQKSVTPNPRAKRQTLARRLSLDLTGLPPHPAVLDEFLNDDSSDAWSHFVQRTLASSGFGERMAWNWLEAARYADSNGYQGDRERTMWPWRDWAVRAFNDNMPFDEFTILQLAGDLMPEATEEQILATGFLRNHMINGEGGRIAEENRVDYVMDMTETVGTVWLGLTFNCCRCHDHKFDPLKQAEYYQLTAFFNQTPVTGKGGDPQTAPILAYPDEQQRTQQRELRQELERLKTKQKSLAQQRIQSSYSAWETAQQEKSKGQQWNPLTPSSATADVQDLEIDANGAVLASGPNPKNDRYRLKFSIPEQAEPIRSLALRAKQHPSMTQGGLARSDSGNFVLTDLSIRYQSNTNGELAWRPVSIESATASFEQGGHKVEQAFDDNPKTGWAVYNGKPLDQEHTAIFKLEEPIPKSAGALEIELKFESVHKHHNLGFFSFQSSNDADADFTQIASEVLDALAIAEQNRTPTQQDTLHNAFLETQPEFQAYESKIEQQQSKLKRLATQIPKVMVMGDQQERRKTFVLERGLYNQPGKTVGALTPKILHPFEAAPETANRLDLARWLVHQDNPLTARVVVNRYWQMLFGVGLVKTTEDFGVQGEYPLHKELLDWLAVEFVESGWDVKHLLSLIVTSEAYCRDSSVTAQAIEIDPENRLLTRGPRFRLPSWMLRDQALAVAGLLNSKTGGKPVQPYQPDGIWSEATFGKKTYQVGSGDELYRRSLYTFWRRIMGPTMFFDAAKRQVCEVKPLRTNTPMHALTTLNDTTYVEAARVLAERMLATQQQSDEASLQWLAQRVVNRSFTKAELQIWASSLRTARSHYEAEIAQAKQLLSVGHSSAQEDLNVSEAAAWTSVCLNLLNLDEVLTKE